MLFRSRQLFGSLIADSHFLILPSRAECFGVVFCEAASFGVPSVASNVGGIPSAVREGGNGRTFPLSAPASEWAAYIRQVMSHRATYDQLALSAFNEYQTRLNWDVSGKRALEIFSALLPRK